MSHIATGIVGALDTRCGTVTLRVPKLRQGSYFSGFVKPYAAEGQGARRCLIHRFAKPRSVAAFADLSATAALGAVRPAVLHRPDRTIAGQA